MESMAITADALKCDACCILQQRKHVSMASQVYSRYDVQDQHILCVLKNADLRKEALTYAQPLLMALLRTTPNRLL